MRFALNILSVVMLAAGLGAATPALAQSNTRVVTIFGSDKCPTSNGEEIVVCQRLDENERYRIPDQLRSTNDQAPTATTRVDAMQAASTTNIGTCSASGPGGQSGCQVQLNRNWKAERRQRAKEVTVVD